MIFALFIHISRGSFRKQRPLKLLMMGREEKEEEEGKEENLRRGSVVSFNIN